MVARAEVQRLLKKLALGPDAAWEKDEVLDIVYWVRQLASLAMGLLWGFLNLTGLYAFIFFLAVNFLLTNISYKNVFGVDGDDVTAEHLMEGFPVGMSLFLLSWILSYTAVHT